MPIYTKKGDKGTTTLLSSKHKRSKASCRVRSLGEIDELNSCIGAVIAFTNQKDIRSLLIRVQHNLFRVQMDIASKGQAFREKNIKPLSQDHITWLEKTIDSIEKTLPPLNKFILPGGSHAGSLCHIARAACRRAERELAALKAKEPVNPDIVAYLNRLSDFLFVIGRAINKKDRKKEAHPNYYEDQ